MDVREQDDFTVLLLLIIIYHTERRVQTENSRVLAYVFQCFASAVSCTMIWYREQTMVSRLQKRENCEAWRDGWKNINTTYVCFSYSCMASCWLFSRVTWMRYLYVYPLHKPSGMSEQMVDMQSAARYLAASSSPCSKKYQQTHSLCCYLHAIKLHSIERKVMNASRHSVVWRPSVGQSHRSQVAQFPDEQFVCMKV